MADVTLLHNPRCATSRAALAEVEAAGVDAAVVRCLTTPLDEAELRDLTAKLEDPVTDLVRRDAAFKALGLAEGDVDCEPCCMGVRRDTGTRIVELVRAGQAQVDPVDTPGEHRRKR